MISYTTHLKHYKKKFDSALEILKELQKPTKEENLKMISLRNALKMRTDYPRVGKVYTYIYNAIGKKELPFYDRYPLVLITRINRKNKTFFGLNLHYLSAKMRNQFVKLLIKRHYDKANDRFIVSSLIALTGKAIKIYKNCIKQYRMENVLRLQLREISPRILEEINNINDKTFIHNIKYNDNTISVSSTYKLSKHKVKKNK